MSKAERPKDVRAWSHIQVFSLRVLPTPEIVGHLIIDM
jgi:hypothetical protein